MRESVAGWAARSVPCMHGTTPLTASTLISLHHTTRYRYDAPVLLGPQVVRLCPTPYCRARISQYSLTVKPENHLLSWMPDPNGNWLARFVFPEKTAELRVEVNLIAELRPVNPFDFIVDQHAASWPFAYAADMREELAAYLPAEPASGALRAFVEQRQRGPVNTVEFLVELNRGLHEDLRYEVRAAPGVQDPGRTLGRAAGSCRDVAWLLVQALRLLGFGSRFVSGYLIDLSPGADQHAEPVADGFSGLHAWTEVYLPGAGWIGLDPTSGTLCGEGHIPLAACAHYRSAAPLTGSVESARVDFHHELRVERLPARSGPASDVVTAGPR